MEGIFLLVGLAVLAIPVVAIAAWIRASNTRELVENQSLENQRAVSDLKREIATLRRSLEVVNEKLAATGSSFPAAPVESVPAKAASVEPVQSVAYTLSIPVEQSPKIVPVTPPDSLPQDSTVLETLPAIPPTPVLAESATTALPAAAIVAPPPVPGTPVNANAAPLPSPQRHSSPPWCLRRA